MEGAAQDGMQERGGARDAMAFGTGRCAGRSTRDGEISLFCTLRQIKPGFLTRYDYFVPSDRVFGSFSVH